MAKHDLSSDVPRRGDGDAYTFSNVAPGAIASASDLAAFENRFLRLLEQRAALYTMGESTSVPRHAAADILRSVCFVLGIDPERFEIPECLLRIDLAVEFRRRLVDIEEKVEVCGRLWQEAQATMPHIESTALRDTLASIGAFPRVYDFRSMAHEIPVMIDYPLCHPVPETLLGVEYVNEYLRRLLIEFDLLSRFAPSACVRVLERSSPDYVDLLANLYEPVAANTIGRAMLGRDPLPLAISAEERTAIGEILWPLGAAERRTRLRATAVASCDAMGIDAEDAREYLAAYALELVPRIDVALAANDPERALRGVFA